MVWRHVPRGAAGGVMSLAALCGRGVLALWRGAADSAMPFAACRRGRR